jgi:hypothetical protein
MSFEQHTKDRSLGTSPSFLVTLTGNIKPQEILKLNSHKHIIIKVGLCYSAATAKIFGHV